MTNYAAAIVSPFISKYTAMKLRPLRNNDGPKMKLENLKSYCGDGPGLISHETGSQRNLLKLTPSEDIALSIRYQLLKMMGRSNDERIFPLYISNMHYPNVHAEIGEYQPEPEFNLVKLSETNKMSCEQLVFELSDSHPFFQIIDIESGVDIQQVVAIATNVLEEFNEHNRK
ncbi:hypothetical protein IWQ61_000370 [Dispira simplex]|nr:hypothetical protein IWQ61_000370 [Dispira simplex]